MKRIVAVASLITSGLLIATVLSASAMPNAALEALKAEAPTATWDGKTSVRADVTCDGVEDTVMLGQSAETVWIGIVPGSAKGTPKAKPIAQSFPIGAHSQDSFCAHPVRIKLFNHDCDGGEYGALENCKPANACKDISVEDDECDPFNFFWTTKSQFSWWRN